jgi:signal transduction histidine kinase
VIADVVKLLRGLLDVGIQLAVVTDPGLGAVRADRGQIEQALRNLGINARDAMPRGGRLTLEVRNVELDQTCARDYPDARPGSYVLIAVSDTGCGMDRATLDRLFERFFTTKGEGHGGLGLATVYGIIKASGGHIAVDSELGKGTTFKLYLPLVPA